MKTNIYEYYNTIETKKDFEEFLRLLKDDYSVNKGSWHNENLESFLDGLYGYNYDTSDEDNKVIPTWKIFAEMLLAAKVFE